MKDGKMLRPGERYEIVYTLGICSLEVAACDMSDAGKYTCIAENSQGTEECMCKVTVNGTPYSTICYTQRGAHHATTVLRPFFRDHPDEPVPEENFWTLWCKGRLTEADTPPSGLAPLHPD